MQSHERQKVVASIVSGVIFLDFRGKKYLIKEPDRIAKYIGEQIYEKIFSEAISKEILTEEKSVEHLISLGGWSQEEEEEYKLIPESVSDIKLQLYIAHKGFKNMEPIRKHLKKTKERFEELNAKRNILRANSAEGIAEASKFKYLVCANITDVRGNRLWDSDDYGAQNEDLVNHLLSAYLIGQPSEPDIRELCRNDPWRALWSTGKSEFGVFGQPSADLTNLQRAMISWSKIYDSINESPESPTNEVIEDNDLLDGYLTFQHNKREKMKKEQATSKAGSGVKGDEVYLMADTDQEASKIYSMNDSGSKAIIRTRQKQISKAAKGLAAEKTFDAQMEMRQLAMQGFKDRVK
jgi:hypothetical protein